MTKNAIGSVSNWILGARQGDPVAIDEIVTRYFACVAKCAQSMLETNERRSACCNDIATDVLMKIARGLSSGRHRRLQNRQDLWILLISVVNEHVVKHRNNRLHLENGFPLELSITDYLSHCEQDLELLLSKGNRYSSLQEILIRFEDLIAVVTDQQSKDVAILKLQGYSNRDIGHELGIVAKTVDRKVNKIIACWKEYLDNQHWNSRVPREC
jgi:DNA-directed RNA polymerase specialized sigma24 family protein